MPRLAVTYLIVGGRLMDLDRLVRVLFERPIYQRLFLAFTLGLFISCSVRVASAAPQVTDITPAVSTASH